MYKKTNRVLSLEGMRGLFAMIVVMHHFAAAFYPASIFGNLVSAHSKIERIIYSTPLNLFLNGNFAVTIFFVLSGYALSYSYFQSEDMNKLRTMAIRRYFRLMFPVLGSVFIAYILLKLNLFFNMKIFDTTLSSVWLGQYFNFKPDLIKMIYEGTIGIFINPQDFIYNNVIWIMYYEFIGSFIVFGFLSLFGSLKNRKYVYVALLIIFWNSYFINFILGMLSCDIKNIINNKSYVLKIPDKIFLIILLLISLYFASYQSGSQGYIYKILQLPGLTDYQDLVIYHSIAAFFFLQPILYLKNISNLFTNKILLFFGTLSYSIYLLHVIVIFSFSSFVFYVLRPYLNYQYNINFLITFSLSLGFIIGAAYLYNKYIVGLVVNIPLLLRKDKSIL